MSYDHDGMITNNDRDRFSRWAFLIFTGLMVTLLPTLIGASIGKALGFSGATYVFGCLGFAIGVFVAMKIFPRFWVVVPQTAAFVTTNQFAKPGENPNVPYGPGGHPAFPWELRAESGNITLDALTISFKETVPTVSSSMVVDGTVQFKFDLANITTVVGVDIATIEQGFIAQINEWLSNRLAKIEGDEAKNSVTKIRNELENDFTVVRSADLLRTFGIRVLGFQIASIDFPPKVQEVRDAVEEARRIGEGVALILGFGTTKELEAAVKAKHISEIAVSRAREDFLAASGNIKKDVRRIDATGLEGAGVGGAILAGLTGTDKGGK